VILNTFKKNSLKHIKLILYIYIYLTCSILFQSKKYFLNTQKYNFKYKNK